ncbi:MAG: TIM barrel protein [Eubacteriales bacterium]|jgi:sugar phosphate isomerase/epimerase
MITAITAIHSATPQTPLVLRGEYPDMIRQAAQIGYQGIELHLLDPQLIDQEAIDRALEENHISLCAIGTGPSYSQQGIYLTHRDADIRAQAVERMKSHIRLASRHGAVVIIGLIKGMMRDCGDPSHYHRTLQEGLEQCLALAEEYKVTLAVEVIDRYETDFIYTIDEGLELLDRFRSPRLTLHLDTFHMNLEETIIGDAIRRAKGHVGHVHLADSDRWYPGHAHYDFAETLTALKDIGYTGAISMECHAYPTPLEAARKAYEYTTNLCRQLGI